ncbi:hypothetical protein POM88_032092 [Heracleum sosnowskyi]|uniref:Uncharacterized protein n=1 Tax=Heracleum sosnowskyi TaxID=360622 RepID=A0AAD8HZW1_9APIA|nr:hypothetical protein POM88_032092 [Heracleum sosnowskyi]
MPPRSRKRKLSSSAANDNLNNEKKNQTLVPYLHRDIWFEILSWLSATCLYNIIIQARVPRHTVFQLPRESEMRNFSVIRDRRSGELKLVFAIQQYNGECSWYVQKLGIGYSWKRISGSHTFADVDFPGMSIGGFVVYQVSNNVVVFDENGLCIIYLIMDLYLENHLNFYTFSAG